MRLSSLIVASVLFCAVAVQAEVLVFSDEFDEFDLAKWKHEITAGGGGNWEFQYYTNNRSNSWVENGILYIKPTLTADKIGKENMLGNNYMLDLWGEQPADQCTGNAFFGCMRMAGGGGNVINPVQSARIRTAESFSFKYGHIKIRAKLPRGDWLWPAIWLLPRRNAYGKWPASGEIDLLESRGNDETYPIGGVNQVGTTLHMGPHWPQDDWPHHHKVMRITGKSFAEEFHVFGMVWNKDGIYTYVDDESNKILEVKFDQSFFTKGNWDKVGFDNPWKGRGFAAPFDQEFYLIMNVAVGGTGTYFPDGAGGKPWTNTDPHAANTFWNNKDQWYPTWKGNDAALQIDYVRVYQ